MFDIIAEETESDEAALSNYREDELDRRQWFKALKAFTPWEFVGVCALQVFIMGMYYVRNCDRVEDGSWISKPVKYPSDLEFSLASLVSLISGSSPEESEAV